MTLPTSEPTVVEAPFYLRDGRPLGIGPVTPASRPIIEKAIARLSPETSRRRFFTPRFRLSDRELDDLTILDGVNRYAIGASVRSPEGETEGVGVARFARMADAPAVAEVAVLVVDAYQGQGVGRMLLSRLASAGIARGIARLTGIVMRDNDPMLSLLRKYAPGVAMRRADDHVGFDMDVRTRFAPVAA
ncbi:MAG: GNAT family N-acetyltransferase [Burkholderiales bacterium]